MSDSKLFDLPFDKLIELYQLRKLAEKNNDVKLRTKLLSKHPGLFDDKIMSELEDTFKKVIALTRRQP